jgi:Flp pilus assembly protein TadD
MRNVLMSALCFLALSCSNQSAKIGTVLPPPAGTKPAAATQIENGNALFTSRDFAGAEEAFRQALAVDAASAEAHYNLALTLDRSGQQAEARKHYIEAANLAPGNKVIWDSPPLRQHSGGFNHNIEKKSYQDPSGRAY